MTHAEQGADRQAACQRVVRSWGQSHAIDLARFDDGQIWVLFAAIQALAVIGDSPLLRRIVGYVLAHCGMDLGSQVIGALVGVSDRSVRLTQAHTPAALLHGVQHPVGGHRQPALQPHHAGPVARFLANHPHAHVADLLAFIQNDLGVTLERHALHHFIQRYGLGCLQGDQVTDAPPFWVERRTAVLSC